MNASSTRSGERFACASDGKELRRAPAPGEAIAFPSLESLFPGRSDKLSKRLRSGRHYLRLDLFPDPPVSYELRLGPKRAIGRKR